MEAEGCWPYITKTASLGSFLEIISAGPQSHGKERFLSKVLAPERKPESKIEELKFKRKQKDVLSELAEEKERLKLAKVEAFRAKKLVMNRLGKTVELIVKLENNLHDEGKDDQKVKIRDQLETRGLEAARDHEMLELEGTPQDIVDFRRKIVPELIQQECTKDSIVKHLSDLLINKKSYSQQLKEFSKLETALKNKGNFPSNLALSLIEKSLQTNDN